MKRLLILAALVLSACVHNLTTEQGLFATFGSIRAAVEGFNVYAASPNADPSIVRKASDAMQSAEFQTARKYAQSYMLCDGKASTVKPGVDCSTWDFRPQTASQYAITIRATLQLLTSRNSLDFRDPAASGLQ